MIIFTNCKINLGLNIVARRHDGYHDIESVMVPVPWGDVLEILPLENPSATSPSLIVIDNKVDCPSEKNLVMKAWRAMHERFGVPPVKFVLDKIVPDGAGLGGGSSDAAHTILGLNEMFSLGLSKEQMAEVAATVGADCPFFIYNRPMLATGIGIDLSPIDIPMLHGLTLLIIKPSEVSISTAEAYAGVLPSMPETPLAEILACPAALWQGNLKNDFEVSVFAAHPKLEALRDSMLMSGALYSAMSGSGSAIFGLFLEKADAENCAALFGKYPTFIHSF